LRGVFHFGCEQFSLKYFSSCSNSRHYQNHSITHHVKALCPRVALMRSRDVGKLTLARKQKCARNAGQSSERRRTRYPDRHIIHHGRMEAFHCYYTVLLRCEGITTIHHHKSRRSVISASSAIPIDEVNHIIQKSTRDWKLQRRFHVVLKGTGSTFRRQRPDLRNLAFTTLIPEITQCFCTSAFSSNRTLSRLVVHSLQVPEHATE
jgi:hypothetical protein